MANTTAKQYTKQGNVISHPAFDRPKVQQPKRTGRYPKAVVSMKIWKIDRDIRQEAAGRESGLDVVPLLKRHQSLTDWGVAVMRTDYETAFQMASAALKKYQEMSSAQAARYAWIIEESAPPLAGLFVAEVESRKPRAW